MKLFFARLCLLMTLLQVSYPEETKILISNTTTLPLQPQKRNFTIHVVDDADILKKRFLSSDFDPYEFCSVSNCILSTDKSRINESDAVLFHLQQLKSPDDLPSSHPQHQIWIFFTDDAPVDPYLFEEGNSLLNYNGIFNWSMTYRNDSDVPIPYGRTMLLTQDEKNKMEDQKDYANLKTRFIAAMDCSCRPPDTTSVKDLFDQLEVDMYIECGNKTEVLGEPEEKCSLIGSYKFYLAFENVKCNEYITEKLWWDAFNNEVVPVVIGAPKEDYVAACPPNSFIHIDDFDSMDSLAKHLLYLDEDDEEYNKYFDWKRDYKVLQQSGFKGARSLHLCRLCEALNAQKSLPKVYSELETFWNPESQCTYSDSKWWGETEYV